MNNDEFRSHEIHPLLDSLRQMLRELSNSTHDEKEKFSEFEKQVSYLKWCIEKSDRDLIFISMLDGLAARLRNVESGVRSFEKAVVQKENPQRRSLITNSISAIQSNLEIALSEISYPRVQQIFKSEATSAIDDTIAASSEAIAALDRLQKDKLKDLSDSTSGLKQDIDSYAKELEVQKRDIEKTRKLNSEFEGRVTAVAEAKAKVFDELITERQSQLSIWKDSVEDEGHKILSKIKEFYRMSADTTLAGRFIEASREERNSYYLLTFISFLFFIGAIFALLNGTSLLERITILALDGPFVAWLMRVSLVVVFFVPATIFSAQAGKHRRASIWYRTLGVRVATLKPYLDEFGKIGENDADYSIELKDILRSFFISELKSEGYRSEANVDKGLITFLVDQVKKLTPG